MNDIIAAIQELIERYGDLALDIARDRTEQFELTADWPAHAVARRVLSEVERLVGGTI